MFKTGFLPGSGGWLEQSAKFVDVMTFIDSEIVKHQKENATNG